MRMFVYGTLKKGFGLNRILSDSTYIGHASVKGYSLRDAGPYPVVFHGDKNDVVHGEVYEVDKDTYNIVASIEEGAGYWLEETKTTDGEPVSLWVSDDKVYGDLPVVEGGCW